MDPLKQDCNTTATSHIMTFSDIAKAAANGAIIGQKVNNPLTGAVLAVSLEATKRVILISKALIEQMKVDESAKKEKKENSKLRAKL